jgi:CubicO group peptidase (beta-lactamase class C family)
VLSNSQGAENDPDCLADVLRALAEKHQVPGAQLAINRGGHTVAVAVGETEYGSGDPVTLETAFPVGSITKVFTATVAMVLVADSDLSLDAPVSEYLPGVLVERDGYRPHITLRQLLSHTSGLATGPDSPTSVSMRRYVLDHCRHSNQILPPGTAFSYSNLGYVLVGHLIETITGMTWWEALELIVLKPLGIVPSFIAAPPPYVCDRPIASGHSFNALNGRTVAVQQSETLVEAPTGSLAVSAADLVSFGLMHVGPGAPEVLPGRFVELMRQAVPGADPFGLADGWGLGLAVFSGETGSWVGHDGNADGTSCYLRIDPADGCVVALTSNANTGAFLWNDLLAELREANIRVGRHEVDPSPGRPVLPAADCVGTYSNGDDEYQVLAHDGQLRLAVDGAVIARLVLVDDLTYSLHELVSGRRLNVGRFHRDPVSGGIDGIHTMGRFARRRAPRIPRARGRAMSTSVSVQRPTF